MANSISSASKLWELDTSDIVTTIPVCIRMIQMKASAKGDECYFYTLPGGKNATADSSGLFTNLVIGATHITDSDSGAAWTGATQNDWARVSNCTAGATYNEGWYWVRAKNTTSSFEIQERWVNSATFPGATGSGLTATVEVFTPIKCMELFADSVQATQASISHPRLDWGEKGRWFDNLSYWEATGDTINIDLYLR